MWSRQAALEPQRLDPSRAPSPPLHPPKKRRVNSGRWVGAWRFKRPKQRTRQRSSRSTAPRNMLFTRPRDALPQPAWRRVRCVLCCACPHLDLDERALLQHRLDGPEHLGARRLGRQGLLESLQGGALALLERDNRPLDQVSKVGLWALLGGRRLLGLGGGDDGSGGGGGGGRHDGGVVESSELGMERGSISRLYGVGARPWKMRTPGSAGHRNHVTSRRHRTRRAFARLLELHLK